MENEHKECEGKDGGFVDSAVFTGRYRLQNIAFVCSHLNLLYSAYHCRFAQSYLVNSHRISNRISTGCDNFHDGLVCWPRTLAGSTAEVDCLENPAVAVALDSVGKIILYLYPVESS